MLRSAIKILYFVGTFQLLNMAVSHACTSPTGVAGSTAYFSSALHFCNGSVWRALTHTDTGTSCAGNAGQTSIDSGNIRFCNGTNWINMNSSVTDGACSTNGRMQYDSGNTRMEFCNGTNWVVLGDPCVGTPPVGTVCAGGSLYAGTFDGGKYMVMPSGCADSTSNPTCSGTDTVTKTWNDGFGSVYDIPSISNIISSATSSSSAERGHYTTPIIAAITLSTEGGLHAAARHCNDMTYGGHSDWYLPSKSELAYVYCKSTPVAHSTLYPQENVNCGGAGPTSELSDFASNNYWSSTESGPGSALQQSFSGGTQNTSGLKNANKYIRCVRRY